MTEHQQVSPEDCPTRPCTAIRSGRLPELHDRGPEPPIVDAPTHDWAEDTVEQIRLAETAAQRSLCDVPEGDLPDELAQALERRVEVNLAQYDGGDIVRVGSTDPHVRELEAPWTRKARRAAGSIDHHTQEGQS
jgi:hypothetical protein